MQTEKLTEAEKARLARNQYAREWRKKNPDKVKATMQRHFAKKFDAMVKEKEVSADGDNEAV